MFSQVFTTAKNIFSRNDSPASGDVSANAQESQSDSLNNTHDLNVETAEMSTAKNQEDTGSLHMNGSESTTNGKRKTSESKINDHSNKRRRLSPEPEDSVDEVSTEEPQPATSNISSEKINSHVRFGSEEPALPIRTTQEAEDHKAAAFEDASASSDDDDDAPEAVDNSAQLLTLKMRARKLKEAKKRDEILQKEKRRLQDEKNKSQAKTSIKSKTEKVQQTQSIELKPNSDDDIVSESTATLQGSVVKESRRRVLPALLPDEILNAEPVDMLPSPPPEEKRNDTKRHKFFKDEEKPAKDVHRGDVTIRVLETKKDMLPPKSSKAGRNLKAAWMAGQRSRTGPAGLKRVSGAPKSFVRR